MRLATTALEDYWRPDAEGLAFLHEGCRLWGRRDVWEPLKAPLLPSPWDPPGAVDAGDAACRAAYESLLARLAGRLDSLHGTGGGVPYWRLVVGPWLFGLTAVLYDRRLRLEAARRAFPRLSSVRLPRGSFAVPLDATEDHAWKQGDLYNLQLTSHALAALGFEGPEVPWGGAPLAAASRRAGKARNALSTLWAAARWASPPAAAFADLELSRDKTWALVRASGLSARPVFLETPAGLLPPAADSEARRGLADLGGTDPFERLVAAAFPAQLPSAYLEGFPALRRHALRGWRRLPKVLATATGWFLDDAFKTLAAETKAAGGRLVVVQHGGGYGVIDPMDTERHERAVADEYWTWGWSEAPDAGRPAALRPMPHPIVSPPPPGPSEPPLLDWELLTTSPTRHPYVWYLSNMPFWDRVESYIEERRRFLAALPPALRGSGALRLHPNDQGWDHRARLDGAFPGLRYDGERAAWLARHRRLRVGIVDHPQTAFLESFAADLPTLMFWSPSLWRIKPAAAPLFDGLRAAGVLHDTPEACAAALGRVLKDPVAWWSGAQVRAARRAMCAAYARGGSDWPERWAARLGELSGG